MKTLSKYKKDASFISFTLKQIIDLKLLCKAVSRLDARLAIPATSSNFSLRAAEHSFFISRSGLHKRLLEPCHFLRVDLAGQALHPQSPKPSDETLLHALIYQEMPQVQAILHCHAPELEYLRAPQERFPGHELLKALGKPSHDVPFSLPVFRNSQNMKKLSQEISESLFGEIRTDKTDPMAFVLEQHGIYCFGKSVAEAELRLEALLHLIKTQDVP